MFVVYAIVCFICLLVIAEHKKSIPFEQH